MSIEIAAGALLPPDMAAARGAAPLQAGYGLSLTDFSGFHQSLAAAQGRLEARPVASPSEGVQAMFKPLEYINTEATQLSEHAKAASEAGSAMTPGEIVGLTVRCHEFMFHCQLTSNIANRSADGLQQLFRQQS
jgi:hypothetical protein